MPVYIHFKNSLPIAVRYKALLVFISVIQVFHYGLTGSLMDFSHVTCSHESFWGMHMVFIFFFFACDSSFASHNFLTIALASPAFFEMCYFINLVTNFLFHGLLQFSQKEEENMDEELDIKALESGFVSHTSNACVVYGLHMNVFHSTFWFKIIQ